MSYATKTEVEGEFKGMTFTPSTFVTDTTVARFIVEASALIDSYVGARYVVPVTADADAVALMRLYCVTLVADRIKRIMEVRQATNVSANQDVRGAFTSKEVMATLQAISKGNMPLRGAALLLASGEGAISSGTSGRTPTFTRDTEKW